MLLLVRGVINLGYVFHTFHETACCTVELCLDHSIFGGGGILECSRQKGEEES